MIANYDTREYPIWKMLEMLDSGELVLNLNSDFYQFPRLLESIILDLPVSVMCRYKNHLIIGSNRLLEIKSFVEGEKKLILSHCLYDNYEQFYNEYNGLYFKELSYVIQEKFLAKSIRTIEVEDEATSKAFIVNHNIVSDTLCV